MIRQLICAAFLAATAGSAVMAENLEMMTPRQLQDAAIDAVDAEDEDELLTVMQEMQRRHMWFFADPAKENCDREPPKIGVLANILNWGDARAAYGTFLRERQIERGDCGCLTAQMSYDEFLLEKFDTTSETMSDEEYSLMLNYKLEREYEVGEAHRAHFAAFCRGE